MEHSKGLTQASCSPNPSSGHFSHSSIGRHLLFDPIDEVIDSRESPRDSGLGAVASAERRQHDEVPLSGGAPADQRTAAVAGAAADATVAEAVV